MRPLYSLLFLALLPLIVLRLLWKGRALPGYRERIGERFGFYASPPLRDRPIWIHAVSVGECEAAFPLVRRLLEARPQASIVMTCTTATGSSRIQAVLKDRVHHVYLPYDLPFLVGRFYRHFNPCLGIVMETEIWPHLFAAAKKREMPLMIANGRLSDRSMKGYRRLSSLVRPALGAVESICAQSEADAARYRAVGAQPLRVHVTGNIKFDIAWTAEQGRESLETRSRLFGARSVLIAGSTHPGEEELVLAAYSSLLKSHPDTALILVPRHPERARECDALCTSRGFRSAYWTQCAESNFSGDILIVDQIGVLRKLYGASDVAYIGGSLVPHGGQNPLEPLIAQVPVIFGPYMNNFRDIRQRILDAQAGLEIPDSESLAGAFSQLLDDPKASARMGARGASMILQNQGALERLLAEVQRILKTAPHSLSTFFNSKEAL
jgi:3-deoxy-D-manno-octulosonic-acid transferase